MQDWFEEVIHKHGLENKITALVRHPLNHEEALGLGAGAVPQDHHLDMHAARAEPVPER
jgi:hypothetical protein